MKENVISINLNFTRRCRYEESKNKIRLYLIHLTFGLFFCGIITIMKSEDRAVSLVIESIKTEDVVVDMEQVDQSIELYSREYKKRGAYILILSSLEIIGTVGEIHTKNK